ncbi:hypothetical protein CYMTET_19074 [Cymbomonas tetramitiformis]|uniref:C17orf113 probable zinc finger domain-containing protein n=1 Tax=Cymbomonas tetramitiformis TaxID=36881 RepID=A0AAE0L5J5_9CHLO|nr:hypothetical protein CYMTET_19074 [Cymbomonas tetramitiformis]
MDADMEENRPEKEGRKRKRSSEIAKQETDRKFLPHWQHERTWLVYDTEQNSMFCTLCQDLKMDNSFTRGCQSIRLIRIREHEIEKNHVYAVSQAQRSCEQWEIAKRNALLQTKIGVLNCMNMAYCLAKEDVAMAKFPSFLSATECLYVTDDLSKTVNIGVESYRNELKAREFIMCLADVIRDSILEDIRLSPAFAIGVDESTDISTVEEMVMYSWYLKNGIPVTTFLGLYAMPKADAESITRTIKETVLNYDIEESRCFAFGSDGASVMTGCEAGVGVRLRNTVEPHMLAFHCLAHKLALCTKSAADGIEFFGNFDTILHSIASYFSRSGVRKKIFLDIQKALGFESVIRIAKDCHTRWLSKGFSGESVYDTLPALVEEFRSSAAHSDIAKTLLSHVTSVEFLGTLCFYKDILHKLNLLSKCFQADNIDFEVAADLVQGTRVGLEA